MNDVTPSIANSLQLEILQQVSALGLALGNLQGQNNLILADQKDAAEGRKRIYEKLSKIDTLAQTVERIAPLVDKHEAARNQATGVLGMVGLCAGAIGACATMAFNYIMSGKLHP